MKTKVSCSWSRTRQFTRSITLACLLTNTCYAIIRCPSSQGGGICPNRNKCCPLKHKNSTRIESGCAPSDHDNTPGVCCNDDDDRLEHHGTSCAAGFSCAQSQSLSPATETDFYCERIRPTTTERQPRYELFPASERSLREMHGFRVTGVGTADSDGGGGDGVEHILAYYSSLGSIDEPRPSIDSKLEALLIVVHGSGRTAGDYFYSGMVSSKLQTTYPSENVLVVAPRFLAEEDSDIYVPVPSRHDGHERTNSMMRPMKWNVTYPVVHAWRYGANALPPSQHISSYDAADAIMEHFTFNSGTGKRYSSMKEIIVIGHSAGGQFTQRWALLSNSPSWGLDEGSSSLTESRKEGLDSLSKKIHDRAPAVPESAAVAVVRRRIATQNTDVSQTESKIPSIRVVVANPRSLCYLDGRRFINGTFKVPAQLSIDACPDYNRYIWGLDDGGPIHAPYRDKAIEFIGQDRSKLAHRYSTRNVVYLSGQNDTQRFFRTCMADFQGTYRRERSKNFFHSLEKYFGKKTHRRLIVDDVGHDHALIFESPQGIEAMFGIDGAELSTSGR